MGAGSINAPQDICVAHFLLAQIGTKSVDIRLWQVPH